MGLAAVWLLGLVTMVLGLTTVGPVPPSKPTAARASCHIGTFQSLSRWEPDAFKDGKEALVSHCDHRGLPYIISTGMKMVACHCGLTSNHLL